MTKAKESDSQMPATTSPSFLPVLGSERENVLAVMQENLGGENISASQLRRILMPSGRNTSFEISDVTGPSYAPSMQVIVVYQHPHRAWWEKGLDEGGGSTPPDCSSPDAVTGFIHPESVTQDQECGGECDSCPKAKFGSASDGRRQACKLMRRLFIMPKGAVIPSILDLPPTSLQNYRDFMTAMTNKALPYHAAILEIGLEKSQSKGKVDYSKATFKLVRVLEGDELKGIAAFRDQIVPFLRTVKVDYDTVKAE